MHHDLDAIDDTHDDRRWRQLLDASLAGEALAPDDAAFLAAHRGDGLAARRERELLAALQQHGTLDESDAADDDLRVRAAVDQFLAFRAPAPPVNRRRPLVLLGGGLGLGLALATAAAWLLMIRPFGHVQQDISSSAPIAIGPESPGPEHGSPVPKDTLNASPQDPSSPPSSPVPKDSISLRLLHGAATSEQTPLALDQPLADDSIITLADAACVGAPGRITLCAGGDVDLRVRGTTLVVERGRADVEITSATVGIIWTEVAGVAVFSDAPGNYLIVAEQGRWEITARRGALRLREDGVERTLAAGETARAPAVDEPSPMLSPTKARPASDPGQLLDAAHALRAAGNHRAAARAYRRLVREHGDTSLARTAQVALGQLSLGPLGDPRGALAAFDAYLRDAPRGALGEEALHGRIEALHRLGRRRELADAAAEFLRRFPRSRHADGVRRHLDAD